MLLCPRLVDPPALSLRLLLERARGEPREAGRPRSERRARERTEDEHLWAVGEGDEEPEEGRREEEEVGERLELADEGDDKGRDVGRLREERDVLRRGVRAGGRWAR